MITSTQGFIGWSASCWIKKTCHGNKSFQDVTSGIFHKKVAVKPMTSSPGKKSISLLNKKKLAITKPVRQEERDGFVPFQVKCYDVGWPRNFIEQIFASRDRTLSKAEKEELIVSYLIQKKDLLGLSEDDFINKIRSRKMERLLKFCLENKYLRQSSIQNADARKTSD